MVTFECLTKLCNRSFSFQDFLCELVTPGDVTNYDKIQAYASGFCPVALVTGQGFVLPGKVHFINDSILEVV